MARVGLARETMTRTERKGTYFRCVCRQVYSDRPNEKQVTNFHGTLFVETMPVPRPGEDHSGGNGYEVEGPCNVIKEPVSAYLFQFSPRVAPERSECFRSKSLIGRVRAFKLQQVFQIWRSVVLWLDRLVIERLRTAMIDSIAYLSLGNESILEFCDDFHVPSGKESTVYTPRSET